MKYNISEIVDKKYGKLLALKEAEPKRLNNGYSKRRILCQCDCGDRKIIDISKLLSGHTKSCGCLQKKSATSHNMSYSKVYSVWREMRQRCNNKNNKSYKNYGGRGITLCKNWETFEGFWKDMKDSYVLSIEKNGEKNTTIDRIDNEKGYFPENCRWTTRKEQQRNTRWNRNVEIDGETKPLSQWIEEMGHKKETIYSRIYKYKMTPEQALTKKT